MDIHIFTLFPGMFDGPLSESIVKRAIEHDKLRIQIHNFRDHATDRHHTVDDYSYGGGPGMVLKPEPLFAAVESVFGSTPSCPIVLMTPQGQPFRQIDAERLAKETSLAIICGHYGGYDERIRKYLATEELSIGDYILTGGELPAMVVIDSVVRLLPGVLGAEESSSLDSHTTGLLQHPLYTRPTNFRNWEVPQVLLSGDHRAIAEWRKQQSLQRTRKRRPDLLGHDNQGGSELDHLK